MDPFESNQKIYSEMLYFSAFDMNTAFDGTQQLRTSQPSFCPPCRVLNQHSLQVTPTHPSTVPACHPFLSFSFSLHHQRFTIPPHSKWSEVL